MKNIFDESVIEEVILRVEQLSPDTQALWGTMSVEKMLAHCNVTYEMIYEEDKHPKPNAAVKFMLKLFVKSSVVGDKPYKKNGRTAPQFVIKDERTFQLEKKRLIDYLRKTGELGAAHFDGKESHSFGKLNEKEWNTLFYKHLDHHLAQFGV